MIRTLTHPAIALIGFALAVVVNLPHMVHVYGIMAPVHLPVLVTYTGFAVLELGILILAVNGKTNESGMFSWLVFCVNLMYYLHSVSFSWDWAMIAPVGMGVLLSAIPAYLLYFFSHLFAGYVDRDNWIQDRSNTLGALEAKRNEAERLRNQLEQTRKALEQTRNNAEEKINELERAGKLAAYSGMALEFLAEAWNIPGKTPDNYRKQIASRRAKLESNGIKGADRERLELEILLMEMQRDKI